MAGTSFMNENISNLKSYNSISHSIGDNQDNEKSEWKSLSGPIICRSRSLSFSKSISNENLYSKRSTSKTLSLYDNYQYSPGFIHNIQDEDNKNVKIKEIEREHNAWLCGYTKQQFKVFVTLCLLSFTDVMGYSIFAPFFPTVAEAKGLSETEIGLIFAAYSMAGIFSSIVCGSVLVTVGPKFIILSGMFLSAVSLTCLGFLSEASQTAFLILCIACRVLMGVGSSGAYTAMFAIIFQEFQDNALTVIGISESLCGIGGILGPLFGGVLYKFGGYKTPFLFLGGIQFVIMFLSWYTLPVVQIERQTKKVLPLRLLKDFHASYASILVVLAFASNSFTVANLSIFLNQQFDMDSMEIGIVFLVFSVFYAFATPLWGYLADMKGGSGFLIIIGCIVSGLSLTLIGPAQVLLKIFKFSHQQKWVMYCACSLSGASFGALLMPTFGEMLISAKKLKLHSNPLAEYGLVSGLWNSAFAIGDILGPTVGGAMTEKFGFADSAALFGVVILAAGSVKVLYILYKRVCGGGSGLALEIEEPQTPEESTNLLGDV